MRAMLLAMTILATAIPAVAFAATTIHVPADQPTIQQAVNIAVSVALVWPLSYVGIALGTAVSSWVNAVMLAGVLHRRGHLVFDARLRSRLPRIALATLAMTAILVAGVYGLPAVMSVNGVTPFSIFAAVPASRDRAGAPPLSRTRHR